LAEEQQQQEETTQRRMSSQKEKKRDAKQQQHDDGGEEVTIADGIVLLGALGAAGFSFVGASATPKEDINYDLFAPEYTYTEFWGYTGRVVHKQSLGSLFELGCRTKCVQHRFMASYLDSGFECRVCHDP